MLNAVMLDMASLNSDLYANTMNKLVATVAGISSLILIPILAIIIVTLVAKTKALKKMGLPGIAAWIPFWSDYLLWKHCEKDTKWFWILLVLAIAICIPGANLAYVILLVPVRLVLAQSIVKVMGRGKWQVAWGVCDIVFWCMMGFSDKSVFRGFDNDEERGNNKPSEVPPAPYIPPASE